LDFYSFEEVMAKISNTHENNKQVLIALKKSRSLLDKIIEMVEKDAYCTDIIQQNLAVIGLLKSTNLKLLEGHLSCCFVDAAKANDEAEIERIVQEVLTIVKTAQSK